MEVSCRHKCKHTGTSWMAVLMSMGPEATGAADGTSSPLKHGFYDLNFLQYVDNAIYMMQHGNTSTSDMMSSLMRDF